MKEITVTIDKVANAGTINNVQATQLIDGSENILHSHPLPRNVITSVHFPGYTGVGNTTLTALRQLEADTNTENLAVLLFYQVSTTFSLARWNEVKTFLDDGRTVIVNIEPMGTLAQINAGNFDQPFVQFRNYAQAYALENPTFTKDKLLVKYMHEGNLSVGAYPWVVYDTANLGTVYNKTSTPIATVQTAINNFKTGFERLSDLLGNTSLERIFELGQDSWSGATQQLDLFFPDLDKFEIASVNSYNRYGVSSGYGYWSPLGDNLKAWLAAVDRVCPDKPKMIGECSTTAGGVVNPLGTVATITSGGTGFPASTTANIPSSAITHNGAITPVLTYTTNSSGVITGIGLVEKGSDITAISIASSFAGGTGANITVNLRQTGVSKPQWIREAFAYIKNQTDFKYFGWFLENKNVTPTDNRDWSLNTTQSRQAFGEGWAILNDRVKLPDVGAKFLPNIFSDPYTNSLTGWDSAGSQVGTLSRTTLPINLPVNDRNVTGCIRLTQTVGALTNKIPYENRLRYFVPFWNGSGAWNGGIQPNDIVTIEFDALFKPNNANLPNYQAPLHVAIEDTITNNYERGTTPQAMLTKQMRRYKVVTSNGQNSTGGWYISFMIGSIDVAGEFIITNLNAYIGDQPTPLISKSSIGLGNVDNTTDLAKPISTLTRTALDLKQNIIQTPVAKTTGGGALHFGLPNQSFNSVSTSTLVINTVRYTPMFIASAVTLQALQFEVTSAPASNANVRVGIYTANNEFQPTTLINDFGSIAVTSGFTGLRNAVISQVLTAGWYLVATNTDVSIGLRTITSPTPIVINTMGANSLVQRFEASQTFGALPASPTLWTTPSASAGGTQNLVVFQWI